MDLHQLYQNDPAADLTQTTDHTITTTDPTGMPKDLVEPVEVYNGVFVPADATPTGIDQYDPYVWANVPKMVDKSFPEIGPYGPQDATTAKAGSLVAEWGGQPYPLRYFSDMTYAVLQVPRRVLASEGDNGRFFGPQQTAWEASSEALPPQDDYWSTLILGGS